MTQAQQPEAAHIVLDLETLSTDPHATVASIGAVALTAQGGFVAEFHKAIDTGEQLGRHVSPSTCEWWDEQSNEARVASILAPNPAQVVPALKEFTDWVLQIADPKKVKVWGNGSGFDNVILSSLFADYPELERPWDFWNDRDMRTVLDLHPDAKDVGDFAGVKHNALHDARHEAKQLAKVLAATAQTKCLHHIAEPATQVVDVAPSLGDAWKRLLLNGAPLDRDEYGCGYHPALPNFDEGVSGRKFFAVFGIELKASMAEDEMDSDAYEAMTEFGFTAEGPNYNVWNPECPKGEGWQLVAIFDTEDGPACWWLREVSATDAELLDNLAVDDLASMMKAKLAKQREKGYGGWNKKRQCTQQHLSNLLREHVGKGDPVDVANFCAFLLSRGETIAAP